MEFSWAKGENVKKKIEVWKTWENKDNGIKEGIVSQIEDEPINI